MTRAALAELVKLRTTRLWWGLLLGAVALVALNVAVTAAFAGVSAPGQEAFATPGLDEVAGLQAVYGAGYQSAYLMALVLGTIVGATDFRHRTATPTYLATPSRGAVVLAKLLVGLLAGLAYAVVLQGASVLVAVPVVVARDGSLFLGEQEVLRSLALGVLGVGVWGAMGAALGTLVRNQVAAVLIGVGWVFLLDTLLSFLLEQVDAGDAAAWTPNGASTAVVEGFTGFDLLPWWGGLLLLLGYGLVLGAAGYVVGSRRDVS